MSIDLGVIRAEPHLEIGSLIERDVEILIQRWTRRAIAEQPHARRVHHQALLDHFHDFLIALGRSLAESGEIATSQHCLPATIHGEQRWETGWSLPEVVRDYGILRLVILDYLVEVLDVPVDPRAAMAIGLALDEAISASVTMYVNSRDSHQRDLEARRATSDAEIQDHLRQTAKMLKEVDRRKNEFLAILGHEMRNPLAPLSHVAHLLETGEPTGENLRLIREVTHRQVEQLTRLADDLLDIARIAEGKVELRQEPLHLSLVVEQAVQMAAPNIKARHHDFKSAIAGALWIKGDAARLMQIVVNLLNNSAKYTEHGGRIWLDVEQNAGQAVIRVSDSGIGIPPDMLPHIFHLFTQGEWSAGDSRRGMGIGLALVRKLVELHGGTIKASSDGLNKGSEFEVRLPLLPTSEIATVEAAQERAAVPSPSADSAPRRILIVDDNVDVAMSLGMLLGAQRHEVRVAYDGPAALKTAKDFRPEAILLDIGLPQMDGYQVARQLREQPESKDLLIVALTGYGQDDDRRRAEAAGVDIHLLKPVTLDALRRALANIKPPEQSQPGLIT